MDADVIHDWHGRQQTNQGANIMPKFCRKPQVVEAFQWDGFDDKSQWPDWMIKAWNSGATGFIGHTLIGDWLVKQDNGSICRCTTYELQTTYDELRQSDHQTNNKRLLELLEHAVKVADEWYDDSHGGRIEGDALIDEARALVSSWHESVSD